MSYYPCSTHNWFDIALGTKSTFTTDGVAAVLKSAGGFGDDVEITFDADQFNDAVDSFSGGNENSIQKTIAVTFTSTANAEPITENITFNFIKNWFAYDAGAITEPRLGTCHEEFDEGLLAAAEILDPLNDTTVVIPGSAYTPELVEAYFRELTGLTDSDKYGFFVCWFDAEAGATGNEIGVGFTYKKAPDGRYEGKSVCVVAQLGSADDNVVKTSLDGFVSTYKDGSEVITINAKTNSFTRGNLHSFLLSVLGLNGDLYSVNITKSHFNNNLQPKLNECGDGETTEPASMRIAVRNKVSNESYDILLNWAIHVDSTLGSAFEMVVPS